MPANRTKISRRRTVAGLGAALGFPAILEAGAQTAWPSKPVKPIMPYAPGGAGDTVARPWAEKLTQAFGVPFVVDNRGGASGTIGAEAGARATPDGTTFLITPNSALNVVPQLRKVGYDARKDLMPVARVGDIVGGFAIVQSLGIKTMAELIWSAKQHPGRDRVRFGRARDVHTTPHRDPQIAGRDRHPARAVSWERRRPGRSVGGQRADDEQDRRVSSRQGRQTEPSGDQQSNPALGFSRRSDHDGSRLSQFRCADMVFDMGAVGHVEGDRRGALSTRCSWKISKTPEMVARLREISFMPAIATPDELTAFFDRDWQATPR